MNYPEGVASPSKKLNSALDFQYNNFGVCAVGMMAVLGSIDSLSVAKMLLIMPLLMHDATVRHFADRRTRSRLIAPLVATNPQLFTNFPARFSQALPTSLNAIQFLATSEHIHLSNNVRLQRKLLITSKFGVRAQRIAKAAPAVAKVLESTESELYLNLRIKL